MIFSIVSSTGEPALIIIMIRRGRSSAFVKSANVFVPVTFFPRFFVTNSSTLAGSRFHTATGNPCSSMLSARFSPITPNPIIPNCACAIA